MSQEGNMKDKYKLWITAVLLVVVSMLLISTMLKITPKKISNLSTHQNSQQAQFDDIAPEQKAQDENTHSDESKSNLKEETEDEEEQLEADESIDEVISVGGSW
jgi:flagellar motor protein MotB